MTLADVLAAGPLTAAPVPVRRSAPTGFEPGVKYEGGLPAEVTLQLAEVPPEEAAWREEIKRVYGIALPDNRRVEISQLRHWGPANEPYIYVRYVIKDRETVEGSGLDVAEALQIARTHRAARSPNLGTGRARVVVLSDLQVGKVASGGGTAELIARIDAKITEVARLCKAEPCDELVIVDPGDLIENDQNVASQARTNDLTLPEQLRVARGILSEVVGVLSRQHATTRVVTVPSNHGQYRAERGQAAGKPSDDFGLDIHRAVAEAYTLAARDDVSWVIPEQWRESLSIRVRGAVLGVVHGHQWRPGKAGDWWAGQTHGDQPTAAANILIAGHYHNASIQQSGAIGGRPRWVVSADCLDGGSDWFQNLTGEVSEPSITTFTVDDTGAWDNYRRIVAAR